MKHKSGNESIYSKTILWIVVLLAYCIFIRKLWHAYYMDIDEEKCPKCGELIFYYFILFTILYLTGNLY